MIRFFKLPSQEALATQVHPYVIDRFSSSSSSLIPFPCPPSRLFADMSILYTDDIVNDIKHKMDSSRRFTYQSKVALQSPRIRCGKLIPNEGVLEPPRLPLPASEDIDDPGVLLVRMRN